MPQFSDSLLDGSFRGAKFNFIDSSISDGRKSVFHTYPNQDIVDHEDLGKMPREFSMKFYISLELVKGVNVVNNGYFAQRDNMIQALNTKGVGTLVHPLYNEDILCQTSGGYTLVETLGKLGRAEFTVNFINIIPNPPEIGVTKAQMELNRTLAEAKSKTKADQSFLSKTLEGVNEIRKQVQITKQTFTTVAKFIQNPTNRGNFSDLISEFGYDGSGEFSELTDQISELFEESKLAVDDANLWLRGIATTYDFGEDQPQPAPTTTIGLSESANNQVVYRDLMQEISAGYGGTAIVDPDTTFPTDKDYEKEVLRVVDNIDKVTLRIIEQTDVDINPNQLLGDVVDDLKAIRGDVVLFSYVGEYLCALL